MLTRTPSPPTAAATWHPVHEDSFTSGGYDGSILFWRVGCVAAAVLTLTLRPYALTFSRAHLFSQCEQVGRAAGHHSKRARGLHLGYGLASSGTCSRTPHDTTHDAYLQLCFMLLGPYSLLWIQRSHDQVLVPQPTGRLHDRQIQRNQGTTRTERRRLGGQQREAYAALCNRRRRRKSQRKSMNHRCRPPEGPSPAWAKWYVRSARRPPLMRLAHDVWSFLQRRPRDDRGKERAPVVQRTHFFLCSEPVPHHLLTTPHSVAMSRSLPAPLHPAPCTSYLLPWCAVRTPIYLRPPTFFFSTPP